MTISELLGDLLPRRKKGILLTSENDYYARGYNQALTEISAIEIPASRLEEMGYVKKEV